MLRGIMERDGISSELKHLQNMSNKSTASSSRAPAPEFIFGTDAMLLEHCRVTQSRGRCNEDIDSNRHPSKRYFISRVPLAKLN
jgi:hypothetical protein